MTTQTPSPFWSGISHPPFWLDSSSVLYLGDAKEVLDSIPEDSVDCAVTSPPYWGKLRDYGLGMDALGNEETPEEYVQNLVGICHSLQRVLRPSGTLWLVIGDCFAKKPYKPWGVDTRDEVGIPDEVVKALRLDGWHRRSTVIWHKPNPTPEPVTTRPVKAHEYIYQLTLNSDFYFDYKAIREPFADARMGRDGGTMGRRRNRGGRDDGFTNPSGIDPSGNKGRNKRSVWTVSNQKHGTPHTATFPESLAEVCIKASCPSSGVVIDPFLGSGTTVKVASALGLYGVGIDLSKECLEWAKARLGGEDG